MPLSVHVTVAGIADTTGVLAPVKPTVNVTVSPSAVLASSAATSKNRSKARKVTVITCWPVALARPPPLPVEIFWKDTVKVPVPESMLVVGGLVTVKLPLVDPAAMVMEPVLPLPPEWVNCGGLTPPATMPYPTVVVSALAWSRFTVTVCVSPSLMAAVAAEKVAAMASSSLMTPVPV